MRKKALAGTKEHGMLSQKCTQMQAKFALALSDAIKKKDDADDTTEASFYHLCARIPWSRQLIIDITASVC